MARLIGDHRPPPRPDRDHLPGRDRLRARGPARQRHQTVDLLGKHGFITALFGLAAAIAIVFAVATGSRAATFVVVGIGAAVILVFLLVDVPDIGNTGLYDTPGAGNLDATGKAASGLWLELTGGVILVLSGIAPSTLNEIQLRAIARRRSDEA